MFSDVSIGNESRQDHQN